MRDEAENAIGQLYPKVEVTADMAIERPDLKPYVGRNLTVIAWLWARTVKSPNPAFADVDVPLASTFMLSTKKGKEAYVHVEVEGRKGSKEQEAGSVGYSFIVKTGKPKDLEAAKKGTKLGRGAHFQCVISGSPIASDYIYSEANAGRMAARLMAVVAEGDRGRLYLSPDQKMEAIANQASPKWNPELAMPENPRWFSPPLYGLKTYGDLFTPRQLVALTTFSDLVGEARERVKMDANAALSAVSGTAQAGGMPDDGKGIDSGGTGASAYAEAVGVYLGCGLGRATDYWNSNATWESGGGFVAHAFTRQAIPMVWDYAESNPFSENSGNWLSTCMEWIERVLQNFRPWNSGHALQADAQTQTLSSKEEADMVIRNRR